MSDKYYYEEGAIHHDHHKVINVGEIKDCDLKKLMKAFFKDSDGVSEEINQPRQNTKQNKPFTAKDAEIFSVDSIHQHYWKDFCDVCYPRFGFESKEDGERTYEQKYETFRQCHVFAMQQFEWNEAMMFKVHEQDLQRFQEAYEFFTNLSNDDNAAIPMLTVLLRIQQSIWNRLREDRQMMEYIYPRNCNISCEKYKVDFVANSPEDEHVVKDMGDLEKSILDKLYFERDWDYGWQQDISKAMVHQVDYYNDEEIEWDETAGSLTQQLAETIINSYNYSLSTFESEYEHLVTARHGSVIHAIVYRLFMSYQTSLDEIKSIIEDYPAEICLVKLTDVRSELIEEFKKNKLGKHWYECIKSQNGLEKVGRFLINHRNTISEEEEERFFYLLDEICIITDILKGNAAKYWLNVEYEHMAELPEAPIAVQEDLHKDNVVDAIHELTDVVKESLKKPRNEFKVYPQAGSTANLGCQMQSPEFKVIPPSEEQQPALESRSATKGDACQSKNKEGDENV